MVSCGSPAKYSAVAATLSLAHMHLYLFRGSGRGLVVHRTYATAIQIKRNDLMCSANWVPSTGLNRYVSQSALNDLVIALIS